MRTWCSGEFVGGNADHGDIALGNAVSLVQAPVARPDAAHLRSRYDRVRAAGYQQHIASI
jgi:hypothetical protein